MKFKFNIQKFIMFLIILFLIGFNYLLLETINIKNIIIHNHTKQNVNINKQKEELQKNIQYKIKELKSLQSHTEDLSKQNTKYENIVKKLMSIGKTPQHYIIPTPISRGSYERYKDSMEYVGEWLCTYYAPVPAECSNNRGITASGKPITPGETVAIDKRYWHFGTKFYIEALGIVVVAEDTGSAIKGRNRIDIATLSTLISGSGSFKSKVYLIKE